MKVGQCVKYTGTDGFGKFTYIGEVIAVGLPNNFVELYIPNTGVMGFSQDENDSEFKVIAKPANFDQLKHDFIPRVGTDGTREPYIDKPRSTIQSAPPNIHSNAPVVAKPKGAKGDNKLRAIELYNSLKVNGVHPSRQVAIDAFVSQLGFGKNTASTYQYNCKSDWCK